MAAMTALDKQALRNLIADEGTYTESITILNSGSKANLSDNAKTTHNRVFASSARAASEVLSGLQSGGLTLSDSSRATINNLLPPGTASRFETDLEAVV